MSTIFHTLVPFVVAAFVGCLLALAELFHAFDRDVDSAFQNRWSWVLLLLNASAAVAVYFLVRLARPEDTNPLFTALVVGVTFPAILRSRFTFYRNPGDGKFHHLSEISLPIDRIYSNIQARCHTEVNASIANRDSEWAEIIAQSNFDLERAIMNQIQAGRLEAQKGEDLKKFNSIRETYAAHPERMRHTLAIFYIRIVPRSVAKSRVSALSAPAVAPPVSDAPQRSS